MKSNDRMIEADGVHSPTDQLNDELCRLLPIAPGPQCRHLGVNRYHLSPTDASSITIGNNYNHYNTSISHKQSTSFIADTESLSPEIPSGHVDNDTISIQKLLYLLPTETPTGARWQR